MAGQTCTAVNHQNQIEPSDFFEMAITLKLRESGFFWIMSRMTLAASCRERKHQHVRLQRLHEYQMSWNKFEKKKIAKICWVGFEATKAPLQVQAKHSNVHTEREGTPLLEPRIDTDNLASNKAQPSAQQACIVHYNILISSNLDSTK